MIRKSENRDVGIRVRDLLWINPRDVRDHELRLADAVGRDQTMVREQDLQLAPEEEVDACQQDRRHLP